jgi:hypothetical protein
LSFVADIGSFDGMVLWDFPRKEIAAFWARPKMSSAVAKPLPGGTHADLHDALSDPDRGGSAKGHGWPSAGFIE